MGIRLVRYKKFNSEGSDSNLKDHDELINRDLMNQHPIYAITGLQEVLNMLEDSIQDTNDLLLKKDKATNKRIDDLLLEIPDVKKMLAEITQYIQNFSLLNAVKETKSLHLDYDDKKKELSGYVKLHEQENIVNGISVFSDGLFVNRTEMEDSNTISWFYHSFGESLNEMIDKGFRFSITGELYTYNQSDMNAWIYDTNSKSIYIPNKTQCFTGIVSKDYYDEYIHEITIRSEGENNYQNSYMNGIVIGFVLDDKNKPHTLSVNVVGKGWNNWSWILSYNHNGQNQNVIFTKGNGLNGTIPDGSILGAWENYPEGIRIRVEKHKNIITAVCSNWNDPTTYNEDTEITFNLDNYSFGKYFKETVRYGYCTFAQPNSYFYDVQFTSNVRTSADKFIAHVKISKEPNNNIIEKEDGIYSEYFHLSQEINNALEKKTDGYFVEKFILSKEKDNAIEKLEDGYYVRAHENIRRSVQTNHKFQIGDFIYYHPTDGYKKASAIDDYDSNIVGMVTKIIDDNTFEYMWSGFFATDLFSESKGIIQGMPLYISEEIPGTVVQEQPDISKAVGYPVENKGIIISIERGIQYNQEASIADFKISANTYNVRSDGFIRVVDNIDYKQSLLERLLNTLDESFKEKYLIFDDVNQTVCFYNTEDLLVSNKVPTGMNLFIKAF